MKKVINVDLMKTIGYFNEEDSLKTKQMYESMGYIDVEFDRDGDLCVWEDE